MSEVGSPTGAAGTGAHATPDTDAGAGEPGLPPTLPWEDRAPRCGTLPGGADDAVWNALEMVGHLAEVEPTGRSFLRWLEHRFDLDPAAASSAAEAVRAAGLARLRGHVWTVTAAGDRWLDREDPAFVIGHLHRNVRFVGELLAAALEPTTASELLVVANESFGMAWRTETELTARRAWLASAGLLGTTEDRRLVTTDAGRALLGRLAVQTPVGRGPLGGRDTEPPPRPGAATAFEVVALLAEVEAAARDVTDPTRFERAVLAAFGVLGFDGRRVGRQGPTALVLNADLGRDRSYRVVVDAVPAADGVLTDDRVDWLALLDRERRLEAEHLVVVGPGPAGERLFERGRRVGAVVLGTDRLAALVRQHVAAPVGLEDYRALLARPGEPRIDLVAAPAEHWVRQARLAGRVVAVLRGRAERAGPLTARELALLLDDDGDPVDEAEVATVLDALANPLLGVLTGDTGSGFVAAAPARVVARRLRVLGAALGAITEEPAEGPSIADVAGTGAGPTLDIRSY